MSEMQVSCVPLAIGNYSGGEKACAYGRMELLKFLHLWAIWSLS